MKTKSFKIFTVFTCIVIFSVYRCFISVEPTPAEMQKQKTDSIVADREKKIDRALTQLKELVKKQMKDPSSFELLDRTYDKKDTLNVVKLVIKYSGTNSFGGRVTNVTFGTYDIKADSVIITETRQE